MESQSDGPLLDALTQREREILEMLAERQTDREIAEALNLALPTVKWYNREIYDKLAVSNRREAAARAEEMGLLDGGLRETRHNLPAQVTSFVGREREVAEINRLLRDVRLLTLTGPPGTGKTRLALRAVAELLGDFEDGVFFVDLAPIGQPELVGDTIAEALGIREVAGLPITETLKSRLKNKKFLLLLDNFEQVIDAASLVVDLLAASPALKVLVTSREALQVYGEQEYPVPPLTLPDLSHPEPLPLLLQIEAVALFIQRARAVKPNFAVAQEDTHAVAEICMRLDGLPLAIELAAARVKLFSPQVLLGQLESRLNALRGGLRGLSPRHQTLRGAIDWSYDLLDDAEKTLFARLSVFQGGRTSDAVQQVCSHDLSSDVLERLEWLVNKSLLWHEEGATGEPRFYMLETIHEYGREALGQMGETTVMRRRHAGYFLALAEQGGEALRGPNQNAWITLLGQEVDNLRAALDWSVGGADPELGLRLAGALFRFWYQTGRSAEARRWLERALQTAHEADAETRARALVNMGLVLTYLGAADHPQYRAWTDEGLALYRELGDIRGEALGLLAKTGSSTLEQDKVEASGQLVEQALALAHEIEDTDTIAFALLYLGEFARAREDFEQARQHHEDSLAIYRELDNRFLIALQSFNLGYTYLALGDLKRMGVSLREGLEVAAEQGLQDAAGWMCSGMACLASENGQPVRAARLFGVWAGVLESSGMQTQPQDQAAIDPYLTATKEELDRATFQAAWDEGRAMSMAEAVNYALDSGIAARRTSG